MYAGCFIIHVSKQANKIPRDPTKENVSDNVFKRPLKGTLDTTRAISGT